MGKGSAAPRPFSGYVEAAETTLPATDTLTQATATDGGGVRGYSMLVILQELMHRVYVESEGKPPSREATPKPCDYFDLIVGTGTGGLIAIMLGRLRLDLETCMNVYVRMTKRVFETDKTIAGIPYKHTLFKASKLEEAIRECVRDHTVFEDEGNDGTSTGGREFGDLSSPASTASAAPVRRSMSIRSSNSISMNGPSVMRNSIVSPTFSGWGNPNASLYDGRENRTKTAVTAIYQGTPKNGSSALLRSYDSRKEPPPEFNCTIWQAGRATCATGLAFKPIQIGQTVFIDEGAGNYNPAITALEETISEWPARDIGVLSASVPVNVLKGVASPSTNGGKSSWAAAWACSPKPEGGSFPKSRPAKPLINRCSRPSLRNAEYHRRSITGSMPRVKSAL